MARSLSVKIPTALLIEQVEAEIARIETDIAEYPAKKQKYVEDVKKHEEALVKAALSALKTKQDLIGTEYNSPIRLNTRYSSISVEFDGDALGFPKRPEEPKNPSDKTYFGREYVTKLELLKKNLKVLKMTSQEEVNASTYNTVMELL